MISWEIVVNAANGRVKEKTCQEQQTKEFPESVKCRVKTDLNNNKVISSTAHSILACMLRVCIFTEHCAVTFEKSL